MAETYCGKSCAECAQKESLGCTGCKTGPGRPLYGDCELAKCCIERGHESCVTCVYKDTCGKMRSCESMPEDRRRKLALMEEKKAAIARRAPVLGKWLWIMFWLFIPAEIAAIMSNELVTQYAPALAVPGQIISAAINIAYCLILLKIASEESRYRTAGICSMAAYLSHTAATLLFGGAQVAWTLIITIPALIVGLVGEYHEFMAHSAVLQGADNELSEKWEKLWKWYIGCLAAMFAGIVLVLLAPVLGALVIIAAVIVELVVSILKLVYLYQTAKVFREFEMDAK